MASCILWKCVALWKWLAISLASSVDSTLAKVKRIRHAIACAQARPGAQCITCLRSAEGASEGKGKAALRMG